MKRLIPFLLAAALVGCSSKPSRTLGDPKALENLKAQADEVRRAILAVDHEGMVTLTHPRVVQMMGGKAKFIRHLEETEAELNGDGLRFKDLVFAAPSELVETGGAVYAIVPYTLEMTGPDGARGTTPTYLIGVSDDRGAHWTFLDGNGVAGDRAKLKKILPDFPDRPRCRPSRSRGGKGGSASGGLGGRGWQRVRGRHAFSIQAPAGAPAASGASAGAWVRAGRRPRVVASPGHPARRPWRLLRAAAFLFPFPHQLATFRFLNRDPWRAGSGQHRGAPLSLLLGQFDAKHLRMPGRDIVDERPKSELTVVANAPDCANDLTERLERVLRQTMVAEGNVQVHVPCGGERALRAGADRPKFGGTTVEAQSPGHRFDSFIRHSLNGRECPDPDSRPRTGPTQVSRPAPALPVPSRPLKIQAAPGHLFL